MKKVFILLITATIMQTAFCQQQPIQINPYPKTINVNGSASMEIVPDEIFVNIQLGEYQKKGEARKDLETIKREFLEVSNKAGIPDSLISIVSYSGYNNYYQLRKKKKNDELNATFRRELKIKAIQAAKEKGIYLTQAIGEKLGSAITINEPGEWQPFPYENAIANAQVAISGYGVNQDRQVLPSEIDFKKLKLKFDVSVVFALE